MNLSYHRHKLYANVNAVDTDTKCRSDDFELVYTNCDKMFIKKRSSNQYAHSNARFTYACIEERVKLAVDSLENVLPVL